MKNKLSQGSSAIYSALLKHGYSNFSLDILEYCEPSLLISREQYYIDLLKPQYNILKIAGSRLGYKHSEVTKAKMSISHTGKNNHFYGKTHTYETRKKIGLSLKSIIRVNTKSRVVKFETKLKLSLRTKGVPIKVFDLSNNLINEFPSMISVGRYFNISSRTVGRYLDKDKSYNGFIFISCLKNK
jgi:group I intron endonuclease